MRRVPAIVGIGLFAALTLAQPQDEPRPEAPPGPPAPTTRPQRYVSRRPDYVKDAFQLDAAKIAETLKLTPQQREKYDPIVDELHAEYLRRAHEPGSFRGGRRREIEAIQKEIEQAKAAGQRTRVAELREQAARIRDEHPRWDPYVELFERVEPLLDETQRAQVPALREQYARRAPRRVRAATADPRFMLAVVRRLDLDADQKDRVQKTYETFEERIRRTTPDSGKPYRDLRSELKLALAEILNDAQLEKFEAAIEERVAEQKEEQRALPAAAEPRFMFETVRGLGLNADQVQRVARVEAEFQPRIQALRPGDGRAQRALRRDLKYALADVLTDEQLDRFEVAIEKWRAEHARKRKAAGLPDAEDDDQDGASDRAAGDATPPRTDAEKPRDPQRSTP